VDRHDSLGLRADVHQELVAVRADDDALDDVVAAPLAHGLLVLGEPVPHAPGRLAGSLRARFLSDVLAVRGLFHIRCFPPYSAKWMKYTPLFPGEQ
jgi:hypothetical protein